MLFYVISILFFSITICNLLIESPSYFPLTNPSYLLVACTVQFT